MEDTTSHKQAKASKSSQYRKFWTTVRSPNWEPYKNEWFVAPGERRRSPSYRRRGPRGWHGYPCERCIVVSKYYEHLVYINHDLYPDENGNLNRAIQESLSLSRPNPRLAVSTDVQLEQLLPTGPLLRTLATFRQISSLAATDRVPNHINFNDIWDRIQRMPLAQHEIIRNCAKYAKIMRQRGIEAGKPFRLPDQIETEPGTAQLSSTAYNSQQAGYYPRSSGSGQPAAQPVENFQYPGQQVGTALQQQQQQQPYGYHQQVNVRPLESPYATLFAPQPYGAQQANPPQPHGYGEYGRDTDQASQSHDDRIRASYGRALQSSRDTRQQYGDVQAKPILSPI
ncbi:hypothetical protein B0T19DRAFT_405208 [Cercophora scortea]|uniref:Uncharacterized protein n=1 Tax=Cercophora scortea TaxID=314031 RepID=A0AAE0I2R3_9PEZI|nr:hypothetical protein B0T19DRAFT_405208 [Cercophora scortea]